MWLESGTALSQAGTAGQLVDDHFNQHHLWVHDHVLSASLGSLRCCLAGLPLKLLPLQLLPHMLRLTRDQLGR
jgi:hypothetical protein